jgi:WD40 repeat protein
MRCLVYYTTVNHSLAYFSSYVTRFCNPESFSKRMHEVALDSNGKRLLATSGLVRAPIYQVSILSTLPSFSLFCQSRGQHSHQLFFFQVQGHESGLRTLPHSAPVTSVDWHPTLPIYVTGSADHSVRVTSILWYLRWRVSLEISLTFQCNRRCCSVDLQGCSIPTTCCSR